MLIDLFFIPALSSLAFALLLTPLAVYLAERYAIFDHPTEHSLHRTAIPRTGGIVILLSLHAGIFTSLMTFWANELDFTTLLRLWFPLGLGSIFIFIVGLIDDAMCLRPSQKLCGQLSAAVLMYCFGFRFHALFGHDLGLLADIALTLGWFLFITNTFNLIDGLDGLASGLAGIACFGLFMTFSLRGQTEASLIVLCMFMACVGFLRVNFPPAKIFLGDCGSNLIGFLFAALCLSTGSKATAVSYLLVPILAMSVPILDTFLAIWRRSTRLFLSYLLHSAYHPSIFKGDLDHIHHRLLNVGFSKRDVVVILYLINGCTVLIGALSASIVDHSGQVFALVCIAFVCAGARFVPLIEFWESIALVVFGLRIKGKRWLASLLYGILDIFILCLSLVLFLRASSMLETYPDLTDAWIISLFLWASFAWLIVQSLSASSQKKRSQIAYSSLIGGVFLICSFFCLILSSPMLALFLQFLAFASLSTALLRVGRELPSVLESYLASRPLPPGFLLLPKSLLIFEHGAMNSFTSEDLKSILGERELVGAISTNASNKRNQNAQVLDMGSTEQLARKVLEHQISQIVITCKLTEQQLELIRNLEEKWKIDVVRHINVPETPEGQAEVEPLDSVSSSEIVAEISN